MKQLSRRQFLKASAACVLASSAAPLLTGCDSLVIPGFMDQSTNNISILSRAGFEADRVDVHISGLDREYHYVVVNDLHITIVNDEIRDEKLEDAQFRYDNYFINPKGDKADKLWPRIVKTINKLDIDGVILAADMIDFYSEANMSCLKEGCQQLKVPYMFLRADHDYTDGYVQETSWEVIEAAHQAIADHQEVLVMHMLFASQVEEGLAAASREKWNGLELLWDYNGFTFYVGEYGERLLDRVCAPDSLVVVV